MMKGTRRAQRTTPLSMGLPVRPKRKAKTSSSDAFKNENPKKRWRKEFEASDQVNQSRAETAVAETSAVYRNASAVGGSPIYVNSATGSATGAQTTTSCIMSRTALPNASAVGGSPIYVNSATGSATGAQTTSCVMSRTALPKFFLLCSQGRSSVSSSANTGVISSQLSSTPYMSSNLGPGSSSTQSVPAMQSASFPLSNTSSACNDDSPPLDLSMPRAENINSTIRTTQTTSCVTYQTALPRFNPGSGSSLGTQSVSAMQSASFPLSSASSVCNEDSLPLDLTMPSAKSTLMQMALMVPTIAAEQPAESPAPLPAQKTPISSPAGLCEVCREPATGNHYRVVSCEGCKGFWKRSIQFLKEHDLAEPKYTCKKGTKDCSVIGKENRKTCQYCRYQACLSAKMDTNTVMNSKQRDAHNEKKRQNRQIRLIKERQSSVSEEQKILTDKVKEIYNEVTNRRLEVQNMALPWDNECPLSQDVTFCFEFGRELLRKILPRRPHLKVTRTLMEQKLREHGDRLVMAFILGSYKRVNNENSEYTLQFSSQRYTEAEVDMLPETKRKVCKPFFKAISHYINCFRGFRETDEHILVLVMALTFLTDDSCDGMGEDARLILEEFHDLAISILTTVNELTKNHKVKPVAAPIFCCYNCQAFIPSSVQKWKDDDPSSYEAYKRCSEAVLRDLFA